VHGVRFLYQAKRNRCLSVRKAQMSNRNAKKAQKIFFITDFPGLGMAGRAPWSVNFAACRPDCFRFWLENCFIISAATKQWNVF